MKQGILNILYSTNFFEKIFICFFIQCSFLKWNIELKTDSSSIFIAFFSIFGFTWSNQCEMLWGNCIILVTSLFPAWFPRHLGKVSFKLNLNLRFSFGSAISSCWPKTFSPLTTLHSSYLKRHSFIMSYVRQFFRAINGGDVDISKRTHNINLPQISFFSSRRREIRDISRYFAKFHIFDKFLFPKYYTPEFILRRRLREISRNSTYLISSCFQNIILPNLFSAAAAAAAKFREILHIW